MNKNINKKDKKEKAKKLFRDIFNVFCYIGTALFVLLIILMSVFSCSKQSDDQDITKLERLRLYDDSPISLTFEPFNPRQYLDYSYRIPLSYENDKYQVYLFDNSVNHFGAEIYFRFQSTASHSQYFYTSVDDNFVSKDVEGLNFRVATNQLTWYDSNNVETDLNYDKNSYVLLFLNFDRIQLQRSDIQPFYRYFTYLGSITNFTTTFDKTRFLSYVLEHRYDCYYNYDGKYTLNPAYDFTNFQLYAQITGNYYDSYNMQVESAFDVFNGDDFKYYDDDGYIFLKVDGFDSSNTYGYQNVADVYSINNYSRWFTDVVHGVTSVSPYSYYTTIYVFSFDGLVPYQSILDDFKTYFLRIDDFGTSATSGSMWLRLYDLYRTYSYIEYGDYQTRDLRAWFNPNTNLYFEGVSWKSFTGYRYNVSGIWHYTIEGFSYYPSNVTGNSSPIYQKDWNPTNIMTNHFVGFEGFNINDYYFLIYAGGFDVEIVDRFIPDPNTPGNQNNPSITTGILDTFGLISMSFDGISNFLSIEVSRGVPLSTFVFAPFVATMLFAILRIFNHF